MATNFLQQCRLARCVALALMMLTSTLGDGGKGFWIEDDRFVRDGKAVQIISGRSAQKSRRLQNPLEIQQSCASVPAVLGIPTVMSS